MRNKLLKTTMFLLAVLFATNLNAQNVKYKKGEVFIDKELAFVITENERASKEEKRTYKMADAAGNTIFTLDDKTVYYEQLAHESKPRIAYEVHVLNAPALNKSVEVPLINLLNFPNRINYLLKRTELYNTKSFSEDVFDDFAEKLRAYEAEAAVRNYEENKATRKDVNQEAIDFNGPLVEREPGFFVVSQGKVREGGKILFTYKSYKKTDYTHIYHMYNPKGDCIGWFNLFQSAKEKTDNVLMGVIEFGKDEDEPKKPTAVGEDKRWFKVPRIRAATPPTAEERIENIAVYLANAGAL